MPNRKEQGKVQPLNEGAKADNTARAREQRRYDRVQAETPILIGRNSAPGLTKDLSASGVFFEAAGKFEVGERLHFVIDFQHPAGPLKLVGVGEIVRVEDERDGGVGVAVKIVESTLARKT